MCHLGRCMIDWTFTNRRKRRRKKNKSSNFKWHENEGEHHKIHRKAQINLNQTMRLESKWAKITKDPEAEMFSLLNEGMKMKLMNHNVFSVSLEPSSILPTPSNGFRYISARQRLLIPLLSYWVQNSRDCNVNVISSYHMISDDNNMRI